ncbi:MAG: hypothetical protein AAGA37_14815 [Actinomycetota bacterium]
MTMTDEPDSVDELISRYLDGEATDAEIARIESNPALRARAESMRAAIELVASPVAIPEAALDQIRAAVVAASPSTSEQVTDLEAAAAERRARAERRGRVMAVAAACVLLAVGVVAVRSLPGGDDADETTDAGAADTTSADDGADSTADGDFSLNAESLSSSASASASAMADESEVEMAEADDMAEEAMPEEAMPEEAMPEEAMPDEDGADSAESESDAAGDEVAESSVVPPQLFARTDQLNDELGTYADADALVADVVATYGDARQAAPFVGTDEIGLCTEAKQLLLDELVSDPLGFETASADLAGDPVIVIIGSDIDGNLAVLIHPVDNCAAATAIGGAERS